MPWLGVKYRGNNTQLNEHERKVFSQNGEDGIIEEIFRGIGTTNRFYVEFGVQEGSECNTRHLREYRGWTGLWMDSAGDDIHIKRAFITAQNVNALFAQYGVPHEFDLLSIDIDGNDLWVWKAIKDYRPRVVIVEYNSTVGSRTRATIAYDPNHVWDETNYFGASLAALNDLANKKGYRLVCCDKAGINAFFVRDDVLSASKTLREQSVAKAYYPISFGRGKWKRLVGHKPAKKRMVEL